MTCIWMFVCAMNFWAVRNGQKCNFRLFRPNLHELGLFHPYFVCKCSFREISMIKMVLLDQSKPISLILKIKKFKNLKFVNCTFVICKNGNQTSIHLILKSNYTSLMFKNIFCEITIKKVIHWGGRGHCPRGNRGIVLILVILNETGTACFKIF